MLRSLLICGLVAGVLAGLLAAGVASVAGEPAVDAAIRFEESHAAAGHGEDAAPVVSRDDQKTIGLFGASLVFGLAAGGLFAMAFALVYGRVADAPPHRTALWLALGAFVVVFLVPFLKYPANPPAVGDPETITRRTLLFLTMIGISLTSAWAAVRVRALVRARRGGADPLGVATAAGVATYALLVLIAGLALPTVDELPAGFPAATLYEFRLGTAAMQAVLWTAIGGVFSVLAHRVMVLGSLRGNAARAGAEPAA